MGKMFQSFVVANTEDEAWEQVKYASKEKYGKNSYAGTPASCLYICATMELDGMATNQNVAYAKKAVERLGKDCREREAYSIDCGVKEYAVVRVKASRAKGTPTIHFVVTSSDGGCQICATLNEAKAVAEKATLERVGRRVYIRKQSFYPDGDSAFMTYEPIVRICKTKPKRLPHGAKLIERHLYLVYGVVEDDNEE